MKKTNLTEAGKRHVVDYLNSAIDRIFDLKQRSSIHYERLLVQTSLERALEDLEKVRLMLLIEFGPELPGNAVRTTHEPPPPPLR